MMEEVLMKTKLQTLRENLKKTRLPFPEETLRKSEMLLKNTDLPSRKDERWKYTNVNGLNRLALDQSSSGVVHADAISKQSNKLYITDGVFLDTNPKVEGVRTNGELLPGDAIQDSFDAMNLLHCTTTIQIIFTKESNTKEVELIFEQAKNAHACPRIFIECEEGAEGTVILNYQGAIDNASFTNVSTFVEVKENANLTLHKIQKNGVAAFDLHREVVNQAANSTFKINTFTLSGKMTRNDLWINVNGENCDTFMNGAYTLKEKSHCDNHTTVDHKVANCYSKELYKGVVSDHATNVFNGKVYVRKDAQKINAFQSNANILLSETGTVNSKPELEIYADDVKCSHGSTTGQLDEEAVFYLRSRGLSEKAAKELLVKAFLGEVLEEVQHDDVRSYVEEQIEQHFES